jgi:two-component system, OmpR family, copper resistance phosphate regulon response regulator CusR
MRVLVVEDYELLRDSIVQGLEEAGFAVDAAGDGETALWQAQGGGFDVIVLDLMLPKIDGLEVLRRLRAKDPKVCVLILTARDAAEDRVRGLDLGADDYLVKPFVFAELVARVKALVRRKYEAKSPVVRVGDLEVDTAARVARRGGKVIELSAREYALLEFLSVRAGQVVSRSDIWEHVYDGASTPESNVVDVFIRHLRKKLEKPPLAPIIHTRRGLGYVLGEPAAVET